jgi:hypothetical protein
LLTGFKDAFGSASWLFIVLAALAWLLIPFAHPVYVVTVVPALMAGVALAVWRHRRGARYPGSILPRNRQQPPEGASEAIRRRVNGLIWFLSVFLAFTIPSPRGYWSASSIFLWGLVGDPHGPGEPWASFLGGAALLALYACAIHAIIGGLLSLVHGRRVEQ